MRQCCLAQSHVVNMVCGQGKHRGAVAFAAQHWIFYMAGSEAYNFGVISMKNELWYSVLLVCLLMVLRGKTGTDQLLR